MSKQDLDVFDDLLGAAPSAASPAPNGRGHASLQPPPASALRVASERAKAFSDSLGFDFLDAPAPPSGPMPMTRGLPPPPPPPSLVRKSVAAAPAPSIPLPQPASTRGPAPPPGKLRLPSPAYLADEADDLDAEFDADELKLETELDALNPMPLVASRPTLPDRRTASGALSASLSTMIEEELGVDSPGDLDLDEGLDGLDPLMGAEPLLSSAATQGSARPVLAPPPPSRIARTVPSAQMELPAPKSVPRSSAPKSLEPPPPPPPFSQDQAMSLGALPPPPVVPDYDDRPGEGDFGHEPTNVYGSRALRSVQLPLPPLPQPMLPPISPPSVRIGPGTAPMSFPPRSSTAPVVSEARPFSMAAPGTGSKSRQLLLAALAVVGVLGVVLFLVLRPTNGNLVITVAAPGNVPAEDVRVFINGQQVCEASPCRIEGLKGTALVTAVAKGFSETAAQAVPIASGDDTIHRIVFSKDLEVKTTGLHLPLRDKAFKVSLDGEFRGNLPLKLTDIEPGEHKIRYSGEELDESVERTVTVAKGELLTVEPPEAAAALKIKLVAGRGADGAHVEVDGEAVSLPATLELDPAKEHRLMAEREGYEPFERTLTKSMAGDTVRVTLLQSDQEESDSAPSRGRSSSSRAARSSSSSSTSGGTRLSFRSDPPANVVLNGRPLGRTPRAGVSVSPGANTVVFVHPQKGRKVLTVNVPAGSSKTVSVKF